MSTANEKRKGLISQAEQQVALLVTIDDKIEDLEIAWCIYRFKTSKSFFNSQTLYCPLRHDSSVDFALKKSGYTGSLSQISSVDIEKRHNVGYSMPRRAEPIEKWKTKAE
jgi:hypothetical protein